MGNLELQDIDIYYGDEKIIADFSLKVEDRELVSVLGPSGTGKTTLLKAVAGFVRPQKGDVRVNGISVIDTPPEKRDIVMIFQKPLLFPFLTVEENIAFGLKMKNGIGKKERLKIRELTELTGLTGLEKRKSHEISGGQQQRVSLARALVLEPSILLMDEPFSSLDANLRGEMRDLLKDILSETGATTLFVTHDQSEALMISDKIAFMLHGKMRQLDPPEKLFYFPKDPETARFFGGVNFFPSKISDGFIVCDDFLPEIRFPAHGDVQNHTKGLLFVRPENVNIHKNKNNGIKAVIGKIVFEGSMIRLCLKTPAGKFEALTTEKNFQKGDHVYISVSKDKVLFFPD